MFYAGFTVHVLTSTSVHQVKTPISLNPSLAEPGYILFFENIVDPDQLASEETI